MFNMMNTIGFGTLSGWVLHWAFGTLWIVGVILFLAWAIKYLSAEKLKSWSIWLFVIGLIGAILTAPFSLAGWQWFLGSTVRGGMMNGGFMQQMMQDSENRNMMNP